VATLEQTTLLGEKFIALAPPTNAAPVGRLADGDTIEQPSTNDLPDVEQVFSLLSNVLNGGDLADLQTITVEISKALQGRESAVRGALAQLNTFVSGLASQKHQVVRALTQLDRFSGALARQNSTIATALTDLGPGLKVLANERAQFVSLLSHLSTFGKVATHVINSSKADTIAGLRDLQPILRHLAAAGGSLPKALEILITFPFPRDSGAAAPGDFTNVEFTLNLAPVLCSAIASYSPPQLAKLLTPIETAVVKLLTSNSCPVAGSVTSPLNSTPNNSSSGGHGSAGSSSAGGSASGASGSPSPTPSPTPSGGLGGLLQGLLGGLTQ
jgi:phospholipid/cholesterol/gamma-HCH transport system substrate-binding protein